MSYKDTGIVRWIKINEKGNFARVLVIVRQTYEDKLGKASTDEGIFFKAFGPVAKELFDLGFGSVVKFDWTFKVNEFVTTEGNEIRNQDVVIRKITQVVEKGTEWKVKEKASENTAETTLLSGDLDI